MGLPSFASAPDGLEERSWHYLCRRSTAGASVVEVARVLSSHLFAPGERVGAEREREEDPALYIVQRGVAARKGKVMGKGVVFGEDMIVDCMELQNHSTALAMTYCEARGCLKDARSGT